MRTGMFTSCFAGSDPGQNDTDGDQINDGDEFYGTTNGLDLPALGLDPCHQDLLIETDWIHTTAQSPDRNKPHHDSPAGPPPTTATFLPLLGARVKSCVLSPRIGSVA